MLNRAIQFILIIIVVLSAKQNIAVYDLKGIKIPADQIELFSDRLRTELTNTGAFAVLERTEMNAILKEQEFQLSGACDDATCLVEVGRMLTVDRLITGTVGILGSNYYTITLKILNVETGEILTASAYEYEGDSRGLLSVGIRGAVQKLAKSAGIQIQNPEMIGKSGDLFISSTYDSSAIELNGKLISQKTPVLLTKLPAGTYKIVVRKLNCYGAQEIVVRPNDLTKTALFMTQGYGKLNVYSTPLGASIVLDGTYIGATPNKIEHLLSGTHELKLSLKGYVSTIDTIEIDVGESMRYEKTLAKAAYISFVGPFSTISVSTDSNVIRQLKPGIAYAFPAGRLIVSVQTADSYPWRDTLELQPGASVQLTPILKPRFGTLCVTTEPSNALVLLNGKQPKNSPATFLRTEAGTYSLRIIHDNCETLDTSITIIAGDTVLLKQKLIYNSAIVNVTCRYGKPASILLNDRVIGTTPLTIPLTPGEAILKIIKDSTYNPNTHFITAIKGETLTFTETFTRTDQWTAHHKQKLQNIRRIAFGSLTAISTAGIILFNNRMHKATDTYNSYQGTDTATHEHNFNAITKYQRLRNGAVGATILFGAGLSISIPF